MPTYYRHPTISRLLSLSEEGQLIVRTAVEAGFHTDEEFYTACQTVASALSLPRINNSNFYKIINGSCTLGNPSKPKKLVTIIVTLNIGNDGRGAIRDEAELLDFLNKLMRLPRKLVNEKGKEYVFNKVVRKIKEIEIGWSVEDNGIHFYATNDKKLRRILHELDAQLDIHNDKVTINHESMLSVLHELLSEMKKPETESGVEQFENGGATSTRQYDYDVAFSYAGEDRIYVEILANILKSRCVKVFYDRYEKPFLWGKDLYNHLSDLYQNKARYCVIFVSNHYAEKLWTKHELKAAQARALNENEEYILPIRLDASEIPGILSTTAYVNWHEETPESVAEALLEKLERVPYEPQ